MLLSTCAVLHKLLSLSVPQLLICIQAEIGLTKEESVVATANVGI